VDLGAKMGDICFRGRRECRPEPVFPECGLFGCLFDGARQLRRGAPFPRPRHHERNDCSREAAGFPGCEPPKSDDPEPVCKTAQVQPFIGIEGVRSGRFRADASSVIANLMLNAERSAFRVQLICMWIVLVSVAIPRKTADYGLERVRRYQGRSQGG